MQEPAKTEGRGKAGDSRRAGDQTGIRRRDAKPQHGLRIEIDGDGRRQKQDGADQVALRQGADKTIHQPAQRLADMQQVGDQFEHNRPGTQDQQHIEEP